MIRVKRVYDPPVRTDGQRILVERLSPRGMKKATLRLHDWRKEVAPSDALRRWFGHDPQKWVEFQRRYRVERNERSESRKPILAAARAGPVTLLYSARDTEHNHAVAFAHYLRRSKSVVGLAELFAGPFAPAWLQVLAVVRA